MADKLIGGAMGTLAAVAGLARHLAWYLSYQIDGTARPDEVRVKPRDRQAR